MIIGTSKGITLDGKGMLLLGLSQGNLDKLKEGKPIRITRQSHGDAIPPGLSIAIMFGKTESAIVAELEKSGVLSDDFEFRQQPGAAPDLN